MTKPDPNTGFPEVPSGYFWEIKHATLQGMFRLELRRKTFWIFSERVEMGLLEPPLDRAYVYEKAEDVLDVWEETKQNVANEYASSVYIGKYPPKNLKDAPNDN